MTDRGRRYQLRSSSAHPERRGVARGMDQYAGRSSPVVTYPSMRFPRDSAVDSPPTPAPVQRTLYTRPDEMDSDDASDGRPRVMRRPSRDTRWAREEEKAEDEDEEEEDRGDEEEEEEDEEEDDAGEERTPWKQRTFTNCSSG